jgi:preprotein translocase subunit SecB
MPRKSDKSPKIKDATEAQPLFIIHLQYLKDLSLENPNPLVHLTDAQDAKPEIGINVQVNARHLTEKMFEVVLEVNADAKRGQDKMFICQVQYAALVSLNTELKEDQFRDVLLENCPEFLFPFVRNVVADSTRETGFPPLFLQPVDFKALNQAQKQRGDNDSSEPIH